MTLERGLTFALYLGMGGKVQIVDRRAQARCPFCHDSLPGFAEAQGTCNRCGVRFHLECSAEMRGCSTVGCHGELARPAAVQPGREGYLAGSVIVLLPMIMLCTVVGCLAAWWGVWTSWAYLLSERPVSSGPPMAADFAALVLGAVLGVAGWLACARRARTLS